MLRNGIVRGFVFVFVMMIPLSVSGKPTTKQNQEGVNWALVVAGSNGYSNYRHQADACHSVHVLQSHGIPKERIVVMMFDDIAYNQDNPTKGILINRPNGKDVYAGVDIDYKEKDVTPKNFLNILQGRSDLMADIGSGKVINSGPNDRVFVYFADHGAPGLIAFPYGELYAKDLNEAITSMFENKQYDQMVFYIEACESGSMFKGLLRENINVFATTASNAHESSFACYFDKKRRTYLGDVYSVKWMEDSDVENLNTETLRKQFSIVKDETNTSHVQEFGDLSMGDLPVADFQGEKQTLVTPLPEVDLTPVAQEDVPLAIASHQLQEAKTELEKLAAIAELRRIVQERLHVERTFDKIISMLVTNHLSAEFVNTQKQDITQHSCYKQATQSVSKNCFVLGQVDYALRHLHKLVNLCEEGVNPDTIQLVVEKVCAK